MKGNTEAGRYLPEDPRKRKEQGLRPGGRSLVCLRQSKGPESLSPASQWPNGRKDEPWPDLIGGSRVLDFILGVESAEWFQLGEWQSLIDGVRKTAGCWWRPELLGTSRRSDAPSRETR